MQNKNFVQSIVRILTASICTLVYLTTSCTVTGFKKPVYPVPSEAFPKPLELYDAYKKSHPESLGFVQKAVLDLNGHLIPALGLCKYNQTDQFVALSLLTTTGIKVLEVEESNNRIIKSFVMPDLAKKINSEKKAVAQIADDIKLIFFMPKGKPVEFLHNSNFMLLSWKNGMRKTVLKFGWNKKLKRFVLKEKLYYIKQYPEVSVFYYEHKIYDNKIVPMKVRYENFRFGYNLTITNTDILNNESK
jgi:hypothetical protein